MRTFGLSKQNFKHSISTLVKIVVVVALISSQYCYYYFFENPQFTVMGDIEVLGFDISGNTEIKYAVGQQFTLFGNPFNVSIPCEGAYIDFLEVMKDKENNGALFDTVIYNTSGKLDVIATNVTYIFYQVVEENSVAALSCSNQYLSAGLSGSGQLRPDFVFNSWMENNSRATISLETSSSIFLGFGAEDGCLSIVGDSNFSYPLHNAYIGVTLNVSTALNRSYHTNIDGGFNQGILQDWEAVKAVFSRMPSQKSSQLTALSPKGSVSYNDKEFNAKGSQDLEFENLYGVSYFVRTDDPYFFRMILDGDVDSILAKVNSISLDFTGKDMIDPIFPLPITGFSLAIYWILRKKTDCIEFNLIPVILFFAVSIAWSIETEQALWVQNILGYAPLFVTVIIFLLKNQKNTEEASKSCKN